VYVPLTNYLPPPAMTAADGYRRRHPGKIHCNRAFRRITSGAGVATAAPGGFPRRTIE
jgi:hypothetical protein